MSKDRCVAFSDGVFAVIITIMVLELRVPHGADLQALRNDVPVFLAYVLSFVNVGIYWNNHHHLWYAAERIDGAVMWGNLHLLFWLSLIPFTTAWVGEDRHYLMPVPTAIYGAVLIMAAIAYTILLLTLIRANGIHSLLARAVGSDFKGRASIALYAVGIAGAFVNTWVSDACYVAVAIMWLIPDRRIEKRITEPQ
jgi:uncharacterized membrane protein